MFGSLRMLMLQLISITLMLNGDKMAVGHSTEDEPTAEPVLPSSRNADENAALMDDLKGLDKLRKLVLECGSGFKGMAHNRIIDAMITSGKAATSYDRLTKSTTILSAILDEKLYGKPFGAVVKLAYKFGVEKSELRQVLTALETRSEELKDQLIVLRNAIESLPTNLKSMLRLSEYLNGRREIDIVKNVLLRLLKTPNRSNVKFFIGTCERTDSLISTLDSIVNMIETRSSYFGDLAGMLLIAAKQDRNKFLEFYADINDDLCRLAYLHKACSSISNSSIPLQLIHSNWIKSGTATILRFLKEADDAIPNSAA